MFKTNRMFLPSVCGILFINTMGRTGNRYSLLSQTTPLIRTQTSGEFGRTVLRHSSAIGRMESSITVDRTIGKESLRVCIVVNPKPKRVEFKMSNYLTTIVVM